MPEAPTSLPIRMCAVPSRQASPPAASANKSRTDLDIRADETARTIAGLRGRLWYQGLVQHPRVNQEMQALFDQWAVLQGRANSRRGRHRTAAEADGELVASPSRSELEPKPLAATTPAAFVEVLRQYRAWHGSPSWRNMAIRANQAVVFSTMHTAMNSDALPKFEVMKAIVIGCGGGEADLEKFTAAWRRIDRRSARQITAKPTA